MYKLPQNMIELYRNDSDALAKRKIAHWALFQLAYHGSDNNEAIKKLREKTWQLARSNWLMFELDDIKELLLKEKL
jgi:hypothetical protein